MKMRVAIRGFAGSAQLSGGGNRSALLFEDRAEMDSGGLDGLLPSLALKHASIMAAHELHMIEIEFLDESDPEQRFFRIGTDPSGMVVPVRVDLGKAQ